MRAAAAAGRAALPLMYTWLMITAARRAAAGAAQPFKQDRFAISLWVDPQVPPDEYDERYGEIAEANFTVLLGNFGATKMSSVTAQLAACEKHGLKAIVVPCEDGKTLPPKPRVPGGSCVGIDHPALWGFQLKGAFVANFLRQAESLGLRPARGRQCHSVITDLTCCAALQTSPRPTTSSRLRRGRRR